MDRQARAGGDCGGGWLPPRRWCCSPWVAPPGSRCWPTGTLPAARRIRPALRPPRRPPCQPPPATRAAGSRRATWPPPPMAGRHCVRIGDGYRWQAPWTGWADRAARPSRVALAADRRRRHQGSASAPATSTAPVPAAASTHGAGPPEPAEPLPPVLAGDVATVGGAVGEAVPPPPGSGSVEERRSCLAAAGRHGERERKGDRLVLPQPGAEVEHEETGAVDRVLVGRAERALPVEIADRHRARPEHLLVGLPAQQLVRAGVGDLLGLPCSGEASTAYSAAVWMGSPPGFLALTPGRL